MKQYVHFLAPLALWVIGLALYIVTITNDLPRRVDSIRTYQLQKRPASWEQAFFNIKDSYLANWPTDDCFVLTNFTTNADCKAKRTAIRTAILSSLQCDKFKSEACNCMTQVANGVADATGNVGKNLGGWKDSVTYALESCRMLMHNANAAVYYGRPWAQKTAILLLILTLFTGNAFDWTILSYWTSELDNTSKSMIKVASLLFWALITMIVSIAIDNSTYAIFMWILIPPVVLLVLYEMYKGSYDMMERPFIHPYVFACVLGSLTFLAHAEMGVLDYDVFVYEIFKCNVASYIYLQVVWKYMIHKPVEDFSKSRFVEEGTLRSMCLVFTVYAVGLMAPYPMGCVSNIMWYTPLLWVVLAFASVSWVTSFLYDEFFGANALTAEEREKRANERHNGKMTTGSKHVSALVLIFAFIIVLYYLRENSTVFRVLIDNYPTNTMQSNASATWQRAVAF